MIDPRTPVGDMERLAHELRALKDRIDDLASPSGTMAFQSVAKLKALVEDIQNQLNDYIANGTYNKAQIDAKVASPGDIAPGNVTASGSVSAAGNLTAAGTATVAGVVSSPGSRANAISTFRTVVWREDGADMGYSSSTRRVKQDIEDAELSEAAFRAVKARRFRYRSDVEARGGEATSDVGFIAEELVEAGITEPVFLDGDGRPEGINYDRLTPHLWIMVQRLLVDRDDDRQRIAALEDRL